MILQERTASTPQTALPVPAALDSPNSPSRPSPRVPDPDPAISREGSDALSALLEQYLGHIEHFRAYSPQTVAAYRGDLTHFVGFCREQGLTAPGDLERRHIHQYAGMLPTAGKRGVLSPASVTRKICALRSWFKYLCDVEALSTNPAAGIPLPKRAQRVPRVPDDRECEMLLDVARTSREKALLGLMLMAGLRRAEVLGLNVEDLDADLGRVLVRGKGSKERVVPVNPALQELLTAHLEQRAVTCGPLFVGKTGNRTTVTSFVRLFTRLLKRAGLQDEGLTPHRLRHAFATGLIRAGVDIATVAALMGHANIATTSIYLHANPVGMRAAVDCLQWGRGESGRSGTPDRAEGREAGSTVPTGPSEDAAA